MINYREKKPIISFHRCCRTLSYIQFQIYLDWSDEFGVAVGVVPPGPVGGAAVAAPAAGPCGHHTGGRLVPQLHGARPDDVALSGDQILLI